MRVFIMWLTILQQNLVEEIPEVSGIPRDCHKLVPGLLELIKWTIDSKPFTMHHLQNSKVCIRKTCPCNIYLRKPHFYTVKLGFAGVYLFFLFLLQNIDCGYSLELPR